MPTKPTITLDFLLKPEVSLDSAAQGALRDAVKDAVGTAQKALRKKGTVPGNDFLDLLGINVAEVGARFKELEKLSGQALNQKNVRKSAVELQSMLGVLQKLDKAFAQAGNNAEKIYGANNIRQVKNALAVYGEQRDLANQQLKAFRDEKQLRKDLLALDKESNRLLRESRQGKRLGYEKELTKVQQKRVSLVDKLIQQEELLGKSTDKSLNRQKRYTSEFKEFNAQQQKAKENRAAERKVEESQNRERFKYYRNAAEGEERIRKLQKDAASLRDRARDTQSQYGKDYLSLLKQQRDALLAQRRFAPREGDAANLERQANAIRGQIDNYTALSKRQSDARRKDKQAAEKAISLTQQLAEETKNLGTIRRRMLKVQGDAVKPSGAVSGSRGVYLSDLSKAEASLNKQIKLLDALGQGNSELVDQARERLKAVKAEQVAMDALIKKEKQRGINADPYVKKIDEITRALKSQRQETEAISERGLSSEKDLARLRESQRQLKEHQSLVQSLIRTYRKWGGAAESEVKALNDELARLDRLQLQAAKSVQTLTGGWAGLNNTVRQFFRYALFYGGMYEIISAITQLGSAIVQLQADFKSIQAVTASTDKQMVAVAAAISGVALSTRFSASEISKATQLLVQAGVEVEDLAEVLGSTAEFASAVGGSLEVAADLMTTVRNVYKEVDVTTIADQLTSAVNISKLASEDLKTILSLSAQTARDYGLSSEQYLAAVTTLRNAGIKASTVATGLRQSLIEIFAPDTRTIKLLQARYAQIGEILSPDEVNARFFGFSRESNPLVAALNELDRIGLTGAGAADLGRLFDVRAMNVLRPLIRDMEQLRENEVKLTFGGSAAKASATQMEALQAQVTNLGAAMTFFGEEVTRGPVAAMTEFIETLVDAVKWLTKLDLELKSTGKGGLSDAFSYGAGAGTLVGAVTPGGAFKKIAAGAATGLGVTGASIGGKGSGETAETLETAGTMLAILGAYSALKRPMEFIASSFRRVEPEVKETTRIVKAAAPKVGGFFSRFGAWFGGLAAAIFGVKKVVDSAEVDQLPKKAGLLATLFKGLIKRLGWLAVISTAVEASISVLKNAPDIRRAVGDATAKLLEWGGVAVGYVGGVVEESGDLLNVYVQAANKLVRHVSGYDQKDALVTVETSLTELRASEDALYRLMLSRLSDIDEELKGFNQYSTKTSGGIGKEASDTRQTLLKFQQRVATFFDSVGIPKADLKKVEAVFRKFEKDQRAAQSNSRRNLEFIAELEKSLSLQEGALSAYGDRLTVFLQENKGINATVRQYAESFEDLVSKIRIKKESGEDLRRDEEALLTAYDELAEVRISLLRAGSAKDRDLLVKIFEDLNARVVELGEELTKERIEEFKEVELEAYSQRAVEKIVALQAKGNQEEAHRALVDLMEFRNKYFKDTEAAAKDLTTVLGEQGGLGTGRVARPGVTDFGFGKYPGVDQAIADVSAELGIDPLLAAALVRHESRGDPNAFNQTGGGKGARGLTQVRSGAATDMRKSMEDMFDIYTNLRTGLGYLVKRIEAAEGDIAGGLGRYYAGDAGYLKGGKDTAYANDVYIPDILGDYERRKLAAGDPQQKARQKAEDEVQRNRLQAYSDEVAAVRAVVVSAKKAKPHELEQLTVAQADIMRKLKDVREEELGGLLDAKTAKVPQAIKDAGEAYSKYVDAQEKRIRSEAQRERESIERRIQLDNLRADQELKELQDREASYEAYAAQLRRKRDNELDSIQLTIDGLENSTEADAEAKKADLINEQEKIRLKYNQELADAATQIGVETAQRRADLATQKQSNLEQKIQLAAEGGQREKALELLDEFELLENERLAAERERISHIKGDNEREIAKRALEEDVLKSTQLRKATLDKLNELEQKNLNLRADYGVNNPEELAELRYRQAAGDGPGFREQGRILQKKLTARREQTLFLTQQQEEQLELSQDLTLSEQQRALAAAEVVQYEDLINEALIRQAETEGALKARTGELGDLSDLADSFFSTSISGATNLAKTVGGTLANGFSTLGSSMIDAAMAGKNFGTVMRTVLADTLQLIAKVIVQQLILRAISGVFGAASGSTVDPGKFVPSFDPGGAKAGLGFAEGGMVSGPGTGTSDSISGTVTDSSGKVVSGIRVSTGEAILNAGAVKALGDSFIHGANRAGMMRRATGGLAIPGRASNMGQELVRAVSSRGNDTNSPDGQDQSIKIVNLVGDDVMEDYMVSSAGEKTLLNVIERNAGSVRQLLGA